MKLVFWITLVAGLGVGAATSRAADGARGGVGAQAVSPGGVGMVASAKKGADGMPGCDGGTDPSADGKFYVRGTGKECNPGPQDRKKVK